MDAIYANVEKPVDNRSNRQWAGKKGEDIYINNDVICSHSTPSPNTGGNTDTAPSKALRCLGLLCLVLLVGIVGLLCVHFARDESEWKAELAQLKVAYTNLSDERDQLLDRDNILKKQYDKLRMYHVNCGCKDSWTKFGNSCYYISTETEDWERSLQYCQERGADLVTINNQEEQKWIVSLNKRVWIGLTDRVEEGVWKWVDGTPLNQSFWYPPQPDNNGVGDGADKEEDCAENYDHRPELLDRWNDMRCSHANLFICEINIVKPYIEPNI